MRKLTDAPLKHRQRPDAEKPLPRGWADHRRLRLQMVIASLITPAKSVTTLSYTAFVDQVTAGHVHAINSKATRSRGR